MAQDYPPVPDRSEEVYEQTDGVNQYTERVVVDNAAERRQSAYTISQFIWLAFGILEGLIVLRIILRLIAANPANPFANLVYRITDIFLWPFFGLTAQPAAGGFVLELSSIIALIVYALLSWVLVKIVWLIMYRRPTTVVQRYDRDYHDRTDIR
jgi:hypothetical protein